ncbi:PLAA (predicted) [Pycnogonum litorale]
MADASAQYKLRCSLDGHSMDVRAVTSAVFPVGGLISGSRDRSIKLWIPNEESNGFVEGTSMVGPTNFVASVCCMPPNADHPHGLIVAGSNDSVIYCYNPDSPKPIHTLEGHAATVCSVAAGKFGTLLSGSWDKTAKVWIKQKCVFTLSGHEAAVWSVQVIPDHGLMLTGSADKTIKSWRAGKCEKTFEGHTDCVRGLSVLNPEEFLSCSNDATIRRWSVMSGHCLQAYYGHTSFIYSVSVVPNTGGLRFVSSSEDRSICVWNVATDSDPCIQTIRLPAQSIWSVACTDNGDIISGSSDGVVRIFTTVPELQASVEEQKLLEEQVSKSTINADEIGDLKVSDLPSKEALYEPGKKDGHTKMIRDGAVVSAYQWSASEQRWLKIGDVVGADGSSKSNSGKTSFEGQVIILFRKKKRTRYLRERVTGTEAEGVAVKANSQTYGRPIRSLNHCSQIWSSMLAYGAFYY